MKSCIDYSLCNTTSVFVNSLHHLVFSPLLVLSGVHEKSVMKCEPMDIETSVSKVEDIGSRPHSATSPSCSFCEAYSPTYASCWPSPVAPPSSTPDLTSHRCLTPHSQNTTLGLDLKQEPQPSSEDVGELEVGDSPSLSKGKKLSVHLSLLSTYKIW